MPKGEPFIEITPVNFDELARNLDRGREYILVAINEALRDAGYILTPAIKAETPRGATHKLASSTVFQVLGRAEDQRLEIRQSAFSDRGFPYGAAVRTGTKPHFPPIDALVPWVLRVLHVPEKQARQVAFLIARKISKVGTKANPYHVRAVEPHIGEVVEVMRQRFVQVMMRIGDLPRVSG